MNNHFFSHLIEIQTLEFEIDGMSMKKHEKEEIKNLIHDNIYHAVLDAVLSELSDDEKKVFLTHLVTEDNEKIWNYVNEKVENIEEKIKKAVEEIKKKLHKDIISTKHAG
jgi:succinate dehydrogenase flavin-adding protein (antitoxin of CptAB toxin-antitoxin module)